MNTKELREALRPISDVKVETVEAKKIEVGASRLAIGDLRFPMNATVLGTVNAALPVPHDYFKRMPRGLVVPHTRHWLGELDRDQPITAIQAADGSLLSLALGATQPVDPRTVVDAIVETDEEIVDWQTFELSPTAWRFLALTTKERAIQVGDIVKAGYEIGGSLTGQRALTVTQMTWRLVCRNGAVHGGSGNSFRRNVGGDGLGDFVHNAIEALAGRADHLFDELQEMAKLPVDPDTVASVDTLFRSLRFSQRTSVMRKIKEEPPKTVYDLWNHITDVATHSDCGRSTWGEFRRRRRMQIIAGALVGQLSTCDSCHQVTAASIAADEGDSGQDVDAPATETVEATATTKALAGSPLNLRLDPDGSQSRAASKREREEKKAAKAAARAARTAEKPAPKPKATKRSAPAKSAAKSAEKTSRQASAKKAATREKKVDTDETLGGFDILSSTGDSAKLYCQDCAAGFTLTSADIETALAAAIDGKPLSCPAGHTPEKVAS